MKSNDRGSSSFQLIVRKLSIFWNSNATRQTGLSQFYQSIFLSILPNVLPSKILFGKELPLAINLSSRANVQTKYYTSQRATIRVEKHKAYSCISRLGLLPLFKTLKLYSVDNKYQEQISMVLRAYARVHLANYVS